MNNEQQLNEQAAAEQKYKDRGEDEEFLRFDLLEVGDEGPVRFSDPDDRSSIEVKMAESVSRGLFGQGKNRLWIKLIIFDHVFNTLLLSNNLQTIFYFQN